MVIINMVRPKHRYHTSKCDYVTIDCKIECHHHRRNDNVICDRCGGHDWLWSSTRTPGYGFRPYTLESVCC